MCAQEVLSISIYSKPLFKIDKTSWTYSKLTPSRHLIKSRPDIQPHIFFRQDLHSKRATLNEKLSSFETVTVEIHWVTQK